MPSLPALFASAGGVPNPWFQWSYVTHNSGDILGATREHLFLTLVSVGCGLALSVPLALVARRSRWLRAPILGFADVVYAIPAVALIVALVPAFGLSAFTVIIPLVGYTLVILVRNVLVGLDEVSPDAVEAARGMGFGPVRLLWQVQLPLAVPSIVAGLRIATVSTIELVVIGAFVGQGGYGRFIIEGFENNFYRAEITTGVVLTVLLAIVADVVLLGVQRLVTPWRRGRSA